MANNGSTTSKNRTSTSRSRKNGEHERRLAALDVGTNSIRLLVVNVDQGDHTFSTLAEIKETVRLGEGEYAQNRMTPEAMDRAVMVISRFIEVARGYEVEDIIAVATSAVREAENQQEFLDRLKKESGLDVEVVSGLEEARLIYLGVVSGSTLQGKRALFVDVGGGSTELIVGDRQQHYLLESLKLGTIRLTNRFLGDGRSPVSKKKYAELQEYITAVSVHATRKIASVGFELAIASSGTMINLAEMVAAMKGEKLASVRQYPVQMRDLVKIREMICKAGYEERRKIPGIKPERADIMVAGIAVLETLFNNVNAQTLQVSEYGLREGIIVDQIIRDQDALRHYTATSPRLRSVQQLAKACGYEEEHCMHIRHLALSIFDQMIEHGIVMMGWLERELLEYSAYLHDVGFFLSHTNHHQHAYYIIRNSELLGFNDREQAILANLALYHRKSVPKKKHLNFVELDLQAKEMVEKLSAILRIAEGLDRSHLSLVKDISLKPGSDGSLEMLLISDSDCQLEVWGVENQVPVFESVFGKRLHVKVGSPAVV